MDELTEQSRSVTANTEAFALEEGHSAETPRLARINAPSKRHPFFGELYRSDAILDVIEPLLGPDIRHQGEKLNMKTAGGGSAVEWHQDIAFYPYTNDDVLAVGVCLDDHTLENGCMLMIPGSHKGRSWTIIRTATSSARSRPAAARRTSAQPFRWRSEPGE